MKKIIIDEDDRNTIDLSQVDNNRPIFAKRDGVICGMVIKEDSGWILRLGGRLLATGFHDTLRECLISCRELGFEFYI